MHAHSSLATRMCSGGYCTNIYVGDCVFPALVIQNLWVCLVASLQEMCNIDSRTSICVGGCVFLAFIIQNLWVCTAALLQECAA